MTIAIFATQNGIGKKFMPDKTLLSAPRFQTDDTVKNLYDLEKHVRSQKKAWPRWHRWETLLRNMKALWIKLSRELWIPNIDPVIYLKQLYYWDWLPFGDILTRINGKWVNYKTEDWVRKLFTEVFGWKPRGSDEVTIITNKKVQAQMKERVKQVRWESKKLEDTRRLTFTLWFIEHAKEAENPYFDILVYEWAENKRLKIAYLLELYYWIGNKELNKLRKSGIGTRVIARYLEPIINDILTRLWWDELVITPAEIGRML